MEAEQEALSKVLVRLDKLRNITDTSFVDDLVKRRSKTKDLEVQRFLTLKILKEYQRLEQNFPGVDDLYPVIKDKEGFEIGNLVYNGQNIGRFSLSLEDLNRNTLIIGSTGHGKTSLILKILDEISKSGIRYLVFDMKNDYPSLSLAGDSVYISKNNLRINPLEPPKNTFDNDWAVHFSDVFSDSFSLLVGSRDYLLENVINLLSSWDKDFPPALKDLLAYLKDYGRRNDYFKVVYGRINSLIISSNVFDCNNGISLEKLKDKNIVISMENFGTVESHFLVSFILSYFYYSALNDHRDGSFKRMFVIDDAHSILDVNQEKDYARGIPVLHSIIAKIRELGFGFIFSDQQISSVISSAIQNTNTKFIGKVNLLQDLPKIFPAGYNIASEIEKLGKGEFILLNEAISPFCVFKADYLGLNSEITPNLVKIKEKIDLPFLSYFKAEETNRKEGEFLKEVDKNPAFNLNMHYSSLSNTMDRKKFDEIKHNLLKEGTLSEISILMEEGKTHKFLFVSKTSEKLGKLNLKCFDEDSFFKLVMKEFVGGRLRNKKIRYREEDSGFLISGLIKTYIFIEQNTENLLKILETSFDRVFFIVKDGIKEEDILADIIKKGKTNSFINMKNLKIMHFSDFLSALQ